MDVVGHETPKLLNFVHVVNLRPCHMSLTKDVQ